MERRPGRGRRRVLRINLSVWKFNSIGTGTSKEVEKTPRDAALWSILALFDIPFEILVSFLLQKPSFSDPTSSPCLSTLSSIDDGGFHLTIQTEHDDDLAVRSLARASQIGVKASRSVWALICAFPRPIVAHFPSRLANHVGNNRLHLISRADCGNICTHPTFRPALVAGLSSRIGPIVDFLALPSSCTSRTTLDIQTDSYSLSF